MSDCAVCVYHASNVTADQIGDAKCPNCGRLLSQHPLHARESIAAGTCFAVNHDVVREWRLEP